MKVIVAGAGYAGTLDGGEDERGRAIMDEYLRSVTDPRVIAGALPEAR